MAADYIALLRGINVGGFAKVPMSGLRDLCVDIELDNPRTLLQSGNLVFRCAKTDPTRLEQRLEKEIAARLGVACAVVVRTPDEWQRLIARNPFADEARRDPGHLLAMVLKTAPEARTVKALEKIVPGRERVRAGDRTLYIVYPDGVGRSKLTNQLIEKTLGTRGTARNWNTVLRLAAAVSATNPAR